MPVEAIGLAPQAQELSNTSLTQDDFIKLFLTELTYQDPLEPVNNRDFLAQMAQFANLEQTRQSNGNMESLLAVSAANQALGLIGKQVQVSGDGGQVSVGTVSTVLFTASGPLLTIVQAGNTVLTDVRLSQVRLVR